MLYSTGVSKAIPGTTVARRFAATSGKVKGVGEFRYIGTPPHRDPLHRVGDPGVGNVFNHGERGYNGPRENMNPQQARDAARDANNAERGRKSDWSSRSHRRNVHEGQKVVARSVGVGLGVGVGGTFTYNRFHNRQAERLKAKTKALRTEHGISKARMPFNRFKPFRAEAPGIKFAPPGPGPHDISGAKIRSEHREPHPESFYSVLGQAPKDIRNILYARAAQVGVIGAAAGAANAKQRRDSARADHYRVKGKVKQIKRQAKKDERRARKGNVGKLYVRDRQTSVMHALETGAGLGLGAWGAGRSRMLGAALGRGVKMAVTKDNAFAVEALQYAQAAQGLMARATAPGERAIRQISAVDRAIDRVPAAIRPEIALAAGTLLVGHGHPIRRDTYHPVNINIRTHGGM